MNDFKLKQMLEDLVEEKGDLSFDEFFSDVEYVITGFRIHKILEKIELYLDELGAFDSKPFNENRLEALEENRSISSNISELLEAA